MTPGVAPTPLQLDPTRVEQLSAKARALAEAQSAHVGDLPRLIAPAEPAKPGWIERIVEAVQDFVRQFFPKSQHALDLSILKPLLYSAAIVLIVWLAWAVAQAIAKRRLRFASRKEGPRAFGPSIVTTDKRLSLELERALTALDFAKASRLRWKLFLLRISLAPSATPNEAAASGHYSQSAAHIQASYRAMFSGRNATAEEFHAADVLLKTFEDSSQIAGQR